MADADGPGVVATLWGQISILDRWGNSQAGDLPPSNGPGRTQGVKGWQGRSPIGAVQGLPGRVKGVLWHMRMSLW